MVTGLDWSPVTDTRMADTGQSSQITYCPYDEYHIAAQRPTSGLRPDQSAAADVTRSGEHGSSPPSSPSGLYGRACTVATSQVLSLQPQAAAATTWRES